MHTLDLAFDREGQQLIEECLLRNEYRKRVHSLQNSQNSSKIKTPKKNQSPQKRTPTKQQSNLSQRLNYEDIVSERDRHDELQRRLQLEKQRDEQIAKKKKKKFV